MSREVIAGGNVSVECFRFDNFLANMFLVHSPESLEAGEVIVIDPHVSEELAQRLKDLGAVRVRILLTHEHFDHTTGVNWLKAGWECRLMCHRICGELIAKRRNNRPLSVMSGTSDARNYLHHPLYECGADDVFDSQAQWDWYGRTLRFIHTPGHTGGSCCVELDGVVFTGDSLLLGESVITRFPGGSAERFESVTLPYLKAIPGQSVICPGHGPVFRKDTARWENDRYVPDYDLSKGEEL